MTLDEAIKEFTDWAKGNRKEQNFWAAERDENDETNPLSYADCEGLARDAETRAEYHEQLAEWLTELKDLREAKELLKAAVDDFNSIGRVLEGNDILCMKYIVCKGCPFDGDNCNKWRYADEAEKLLNDEK